MEDNESDSNLSLIPAARRALIVGAEGLAKRGLELASTIEARPRAFPRLAAVRELNHSIPAMFAGFSSDGGHALTVHYNTDPKTTDFSIHVAVWDASQGTMKTSIRTPCFFPGWILQRMPDHNKVLLQTLAGVFLLDLGTGEATAYFEGLGPLETVAILSEGRHAVVVPRGRHARLLDLHTQRELFVFDAYPEKVKLGATSQDGQYLVLTLNDEQVFVYDLKAMRQTSTFKVARETGYMIYSLHPHVSADNRYILTSLYTYPLVRSTETMHLWGLQTGQHLRSFNFVRGVGEAVFSQDGRYVISFGQQDSTIELWEADSGKLVRVMDGHSAPINRLYAYPEGQCLFSISEDASIRVWDLESGREICAVRGHARGVASLEFSPNGNRAISIGREGTAYLWALQM